MRFAITLLIRDLDSSRCPPRSLEQYQKVIPTTFLDPPPAGVFLEMPQNAVARLPVDVQNRRNPDEIEHHLSWYLQQSRVKGPKLPLREYPFWYPTRQWVNLDMDRVVWRWWQFRMGREPIPPHRQPFHLEELELDPSVVMTLGVPPDLDFRQWHLRSICWGVQTFSYAVAASRTKSTACGCGVPLRLYNSAPGGRCPPCSLKLRWEQEYSLANPASTERANPTPAEKTAWVQRLLTHLRARERTYMEEWRERERVVWQGTTGPEKEEWENDPEYGMWAEWQASEGLLVN